MLKNVALACISFLAISIGNEYDEDGDDYDTDGYDDESNSDDDNDDANLFSADRINCVHKSSKQSK